MEQEKKLESECPALEEVTVDELLKDTSCLDDMLQLKNYKARRVYVNGEIDSYLADDVVRMILQYNVEDAENGCKPEERTPIRLYLTSNGGDVVSGFKLIDVITSSVTPVHIINFGQQYSMGFLIGLAGHKRYATQNATYLMHDGSEVIFDSMSKAKDRMKFNEAVDERIKQYVLSRGSISEETYDDMIRVEWYMFADEAKRNGFVDEIIGVDCGIDAVI